MADTSLQTTEWAYFIQDDLLYLFKIDSDNSFDEPDLDVTDGLKIEYITGDAVFKDSDGFPDNTSPDEDSILNCRDSEAYSVIEFVRGRLEDDKADNATSVAQMEAHGRLAEFHYNKARIQYFKSKGAMTPAPKLAVPITPYAIR